MNPIVTAQNVIAKHEDIEKTLFSLIEQQKAVIDSLMETIKIHEETIATYKRILGS